MIAASSLAFPASKTLALWWRQLASFAPQAIWVGHLFIHRLEALAQIQRLEPLEPLFLMLLRTIALEQLSEPATDPSWPKRLDDRLHLGQALIGRLLRDLQTAGLLAATPSPSLTDAGKICVDKGGYPRQHWQRRAFAFVERLRPDGQRLAPPHFLPLVPGTTPAWQPDDKSVFEIAGLAELNAKAAAWKERFAFPTDVVGVADPAADAGQDPPAWQRVVVDRPERLLLAIIATGQQLLGFAARPEGWELQSGKPIVTLPLSAGQELPELAEPIDLAGWTQAWRNWCQSRQIPAAEIQECTLALAGHRLSIQAPSALVRRLEAAKNDILKGETWLLAGDGYVRQALQAQVSAKPSP